MVLLSVKYTSRSQELPISHCLVLVIANGQLCSLFLSHDAQQARQQLF